MTRTPLQQLQDFLLVEEGDHPGLTERARAYLAKRPFKAVSLAFGIGMSVATGADMIRYEDMQQKAKAFDMAQVAQSMVDVDDASVTPDPRDRVIPPIPAISEYSPDDLAQRMKAHTPAAKKKPHGPSL